ncbi:hypothetical protein SEA_DONNY_97 [Mycobacterium phage Donny]|uniref:Uncharacterized protein n=3 Tax=Acadianvirus acadian TaxID=1982901 RepID=A0A7M1CQJ8_9CAUD|nr:hypothetical protein CM14_gp97 [Mycobacterium phage Acadian]AER49010.1 hypothetical protein ACADIAN_97 [Mycobacterium phage Acadian]QBI96455.1 hypothetical protein SEA_DONNY_97 [Mycobacterium phage Donny]QOP65639.1 hypothetical protein SEA_SUIGENERIS_98 [Mycobacterium phage Suigeneris]WUT94867.1 hypothetical protein PRODRIGUEZ_97 [Mycobacterium phage PRodriguez]
MAAKIEFTATAPNGETFTRTSGTMPYTHVLMTGGSEGDGWGPYSWHKSYAAAEKARSGKTGAYFATKGYRSEIVEAVPTAVRGKAVVGEFTAENGWAEDAINALIEAKNAPKADELPIEIEAEAPGVDPVETEAQAPAPVEELMTVDAAVDAEIARRAEAAEEIEAAEPVVKKASAPSPLKLKQQLGDQIHYVVRKMISDGELVVPEGMTQDAAMADIERWLSYISHTR